MSPLQAVLLGVLQGITEFIPVSSSGHLVLVPNGAGLGIRRTCVQRDDPPGYAGVPVGIFPLRAVEDFLLGLRRQGDDPSAHRRLLLYLAIATFPAVFAGVFLESAVEPLFQSGRSVGVALLVTSAALIAGELMARRSSRGGSGQLPGLPGALAIGVAQACAILPGLSRSGATVVAGLVVGLDRAAAARFSLLLAIPIVAGAGLFALAGTISEGVGSEEVVALALGGMSAAVTGYFAIGWLVSLDHTSPIVCVCRLLRGGRRNSDRAHLKQNPSRNIPAGSIGRKATQVAAAG